MAMRGGPFLPVGSAAWISDERSSAYAMAQSEIDEFSFSARNEMDWLNEHMAEIFSENQTTVGDLFKTPGKLRGKTPRITRKPNLGEARLPLSDVFSSTPMDAPNPFAMNILNHAQSRTPKIQVAEDKPADATSRPKSPAKTEDPVPVQAVEAVPARAPIPPQDSGYHGSQSLDVDMTDGEEQVKGTEDESHLFAQQCVQVTDFATASMVNRPPEPSSPNGDSAEDTFQSAEEEQARGANVGPTAKPPTSPQTSLARPEPSEAPFLSPARPAEPASPVKPTSPARRSPVKAASTLPEPQPSQEPKAIDEDAPEDEVRSPSDGSSPIRPIVRKSSINFASLPAREPLASNKSLGGRMSRTSFLDQTRTSYYNRHTGGKSLGGGHFALDDDDEHDELGLDDGKAQNAPVDAGVAAHNKTYTQRLQDQISKLGKSQSAGSRPSKSIANRGSSQQSSQANGGSLYPQLPGSESQEAHEATRPPTSPPPRTNPAVATIPGAFSEEDDDGDSTAPPKTGLATTSSPRPGLPNSHSADIMEGVVGKDSVGGSGFALPRNRPASLAKAGYKVLDRAAGFLAHGNSAPVSSVPAGEHGASSMEARTPEKSVSVSNPALHTVVEDGTARPGSPSKSPSRTPRDSPLKQVKNKLSSILKTSKGLLVSSAAISAEGKSSLLSPSTLRLGIHPAPSVESFMTADNVLYPDLTQHGMASGSPPRADSPSRNTGTRRTRASTEREKQEVKEKEKEAKEVKRQAEQSERLEKMREKERERARVFSDEQERVAEMERQTILQREGEEREKQAAQARELERVAELERQALRQKEMEEKERWEREMKKRQREQEEEQQREHIRERERQRTERERMEREQQERARLKSQQLEKERLARERMDKMEREREKLRTPAPPAKTAPKSPINPTRTSPRKAQPETHADVLYSDDGDSDVDMEHATSTMRPPSAARSVASSVPRGQGLKRPIKPSKKTITKAKQAPTVIRVNTTSSQRSLIQPSNSTLANTLRDTLAPQQQQQQRPSKPVTSKPSQPTLHSKTSIQSFKSSVSSVGRPRALELAARKKEQEQREAQKKREAKLEMNRKRAAQQEEERRLEQQRKAEEERKDVQRQAAIEKAKQTRAPPPVARSQLNGAPDSGGGALADKGAAGGQAARPPSRLGSLMHQDSISVGGRPVNALLSNAAGAAKMPVKRPLPADTGEEGTRQKQHQQQQQRNGPSFQSKEAKRMRMSEEFDEDIASADHGHWNMQGPPVRPSGGFKKDIPSKPAYTNGYSNKVAATYTNVPQASSGATRDLFKATVTTQHNQVNVSHPLAMAQVSKGAIPFAPNPNNGASASAAAPQQHKTPARPPQHAAAAKSTAKSAARSSPRYVNGELIELPEIDTDDDDEDDDDEDDSHHGGGQNQDAGRGKLVAAWADSPALRSALVQQETMDPGQIFGPPVPLVMEEVFSQRKDRWRKFRARTSSANWSGTDRLTEDDIRKDMAARDKLRREGTWTYELSRDMA